MAASPGGSSNGWWCTTIDPLNAEAHDALGRIAKARQLEKEKRELIELIERVLEAESGQETE